MEKLNIVQVGEPVLRQLTNPLTREEILSPEIQSLIERMRETLKEGAVGLAAPQVGRALQLAVVETTRRNPHGIPEEYFVEREWYPVPFQVLINPQLSVIDGTTAGFLEGCMSLPNHMAVVDRARSVRVCCLDHRAEAVTIDAFGWHARILQHEIDHLNGTLYLDRMNSRTFMTKENYLRLWKDLPVAHIFDAMGRL